MERVSKLGYGDGARHVQEKGGLDKVLVDRHGRGRISQMDIVMNDAHDIAIFGLISIL